MGIWDTVARTLRPFGDASLVDTALIERKVRGTRQPGGTVAESWVTVATAVPCRVRAESVPATETAIADSPQAPVRWFVSFPLATAVTEAMRITASGTDMDGNAWTRILIVIAVDGPRSFEVLRTATCIDPLASGR